MTMASWNPFGERLGGSPRTAGLLPHSRSLRSGLVGNPLSALSGSASVPTHLSAMAESPAQNSQSGNSPNGRAHSSSALNGSSQPLSGHPGNGHPGNNETGNAHGSAIQTGTPQNGSAHNSPTLSGNVHPGTSASMAQTGNSQTTSVRHGSAPTGLARSRTVYAGNAQSSPVHPGPAPLIEDAVNEANVATVGPDFLRPRGSVSDTEYLDARDASFTHDAAIARDSERLPPPGLDGLPASLGNRRTVCEAEPKALSPAGPAKHTIRLTPLQDHGHASAVLAKVVVRRLSGDGVVQLGRVDGVAEKCRAIVYFSKVVSRKHAELVLQGRQWYIKDVGSSSGTFVNNNRLSPANTPSELRPLCTGDVLRFGVDFRGGQEPHFRSIRVRVEIDGASARVPEEFQRAQLAKLRAAAPPGAGQTLDSCAICLDPLTATSSLFVSPCFHMWHYKCIRMSVVDKYPFFDCPLCRKTFDLEEASDHEDDSVDEAGDD